ncbi:MAG TPA: hypothetical protein VGL64_22150, partial [Amycolatopsis sp.]
GTPLDRNGAGKAFREITAAAGIRAGTVRPRIHDYADVGITMTSVTELPEQDFTAQKETTRPSSQAHCP